MMKKPLFKIELREKRGAIMERTKRFDVVVHTDKGAKVMDELYFNTRGYRGSVPYLDGGRVMKFDPGEVSLAKFKAEIATSHREAREAGYRTR